MNLSFIAVSESKSKDGHIKWLCKCSCGDVSEYIATRVRNNRVNQCKQCATKVSAEKIKTHGMRNSKEYSTWSAMKARCIYVESKDFYRYGGKGIFICSEWANSFEAFFEHIGPAPSNQHSIDRIDNLKGYEPNNVRWATKTQQQRNKSNSVYVTNGKNVFHINDVATKFGISRGAAHLRLKRGTLNGYSRSSTKD
jgi:hypothetical protein